MDEYRNANRALWNEWADIHSRSTFYDLEGFKAGATHLDDFELQELGDVSGKSLLHLQCHFGMDSLSWARLGARVTGVDFSDRAIALARDLAEELDLAADFICSDIYALPEVLQGQFDIVYTSKGVLVWLPDLKGWAEVIADFLKPGGTFYLCEFHPYAGIFDESHPTSLRIRYPYFHSPEPMVFDVQGSYAEPQAQVEQKVEYEWAHSLSDIVNSLIGAGLRIEHLNEFPFTDFPALPELMEQCEDGFWRLKAHDGSVPLMFSIKATKR